jgi:RHS repeat-associated protein
MSAISELGSLLDLLRAKELDAVATRPFAGRFHGHEAEMAARYGVCRALSGLLWGEIDVLSGDKICLPAHETDFTLPARLPLRWSRFYSSALAAEGALGVGWRVRWEVTLHRQGDRLIYADEHGRTIDVPDPQPGTRVTVLSERLHLACLSDGTMVVADFTPCYRVFEKFDAQGIARLKYIEDYAGERIGCIRDASGRLDRLGSTCGDVLQMHYAGDSRRLSAIERVGTGPAGMLVHYHYDDDERLARVEDRTGATTRRYGYRGGRMVEQAGALGGVTRYVWEADGDRARVVERSTDAGAREQFTYDTASRTCDVTDVFGHTARWRYDARGCVVGFRDFDRRQYAFQYSRSHWPVALELPGERRIVLTLDNLSRVVKETDSAGRWRQTHYTFSTLEPLMVKDSAGQNWSWIRDDSLQPTQHNTPEGKVATVYDAHGWIIRRTGADGATVQFERDAAGRVIRQTDAEGRTFDLTYGADNRVTALCDAAGGITRFECNGHGWPLQLTRADGSDERHDWNALGQRTQYVGADGQGRAWERDGRGRVLREINEEGHAIAHAYDAHGRRVRTTSGNGAVQTFEWDAVGRPSRSTDENGVTQDFTYTDSGALATLTASAGGQVRREVYSYDPLGRLVRRDTTHSRYRFDYAADGHLQAVSRTPTAEGEALGIVETAVRYTHDEMGKPLSEEGPHSKLRFGYDDAGRLIGVLLPQQQTVQITRDDTGVVTLIGIDGQHVAEFAFDPMQREVVRMQGDLLTYTGYDAIGAPLWWRAVLHSETAEREIVPEDLRLWRAVSYGAGGKVVQTVDHRYGTTHLDYDRSGNLLRRVTDDLGIERFSWDGAGTQLDPSRSLVGPVRRDNHRLTEFAGWRYEYDAWGQVIAKSGNRDAMALEWDAEGHLIAVRVRDRLVRYQYDALGRCIERTVTVRQAPGRALPATPPRITRFVWHDDTLRQILEADRVRTYLYVPAGQGSGGDVPLTCIDQPLDAAGQPGAMRFLHYQTDVAGTAVALTDEAGAEVWSGRYTALGRLLAQDGPAVAGGQPLRLAGQFADDETGLHWHGRRVYDPDIGRYLSPDRRGGDGVNPYAYRAPTAKPAPSPHAQGPAMADDYWTVADTARRHAMIASGAEKDWG